MTTWRNIRLCDSCWATVNNIPRQPVTTPPDGGTCELCGVRPACIFKRMSDDEVAYWRSNVPLFDAPPLEALDYGPSWGAIILLMAAFAAVFVALALLGHPFWS